MRQLDFRHFVCPAQVLRSATPTMLPVVGAEGAAEAKDGES